MSEGRFDWRQIVGVRHMFFFFRKVVWIVVVWFLLRQLVWARNGIGELFLVMLCNQREACLRCLLR